MSDQHATTPEPTPTLPGDLYAIFAIDGPFRGEWNGDARGSSIEVFCSPKEAEDDAVSCPLGHWRSALIGVSPEWKDKAERAEKEVERLTAEVGALQDIAVMQWGSGGAWAGRFTGMLYPTKAEAVAAHREAAGIAGA